MPGRPALDILTNPLDVLPGDRSAMDIPVGPGAHARVTAQAATMIRGRDANHASRFRQFLLDAGPSPESPDRVIPSPAARVGLAPSTPTPRTSGPQPVGPPVDFLTGALPGRAHAG